MIEFKVRLKGYGWSTEVTSYAKDESEALQAALRIHDQQPRGTGRLIRAEIIKPHKGPA